MTRHKEDTVIRTVLEIINENGLEGIGEAVSILINEAMKIERSSVYLYGQFIMFNSLSYIGAVQKH